MPEPGKLLPPSASSFVVAQPPLNFVEGGTGNPLASPDVIYTVRTP